MSGSFLGSPVFRVIKHDLGGLDVSELVEAGVAGNRLSCLLAWSCQPEVELGSHLLQQFLHLTPMSSALSKHLMVFLLLPFFTLSMIYRNLFLRGDAKKKMRWINTRRDYSVCKLFFINQSYQKIKPILITPGSYIP